MSTQAGAPPDSECVRMTDAVDRDERLAAGRRWPLVVALLIVGGIYLASVPGIWCLHPDSPYYLGVGRSLARGQGYTFNYARFAKYPPVFPLMLAAVFATVGGSIGAMQATVAATGVGAVAAAYWLLRPRVGGRAALAVALLAAACTWFSVHACAFILSGMPYTCFSLVALSAAERRIRSGRRSVLGWVLVAALVMLALYTHLAGVSLVAGVAAGVLFAREQKRPAAQRLAAGALVGAACAVVAALWIVRSGSARGKASYRGLMQGAPAATASRPLPKLRMRATEWAATPLSMSHTDLSWPVAAGLLGLLVVPGLVRGFRRHRSCAEFYLCAYLLLGYVYGGPGGHERYVVPVVPLLLYYGCLSLRVLRGGVARATGARRGGPEESAWLLMGAAFLAVLGPAVYRRLKGRAGAWPLQSTERARVKLAALGELDEWFAQWVPRDAVVFVADGGAAAAILHYRTGRRTVRCRPGHTGVRLLVSAWQAEGDFAVRTRGGLSPPDAEEVLDGHRDCFTLLASSKRLWLYRIHKLRLRQVAAAALRKPSPRAP